MEGYTKNLSLLKQGCFYSTENSRALLEADKILDSQRTDKSQPTSAKQWHEFLRSKGNFYHGFVNKKFFEHVSQPSSPTGFCPNHYAIKGQVLPSEALDSLIKGLTFLDCGAIMDVGYYKAILEVIGKEKFDVIFSRESETPLCIGRKNLLNPINSLIVGKEYKKISQLKKGEMAHIRSIEDYRIKHLNGEAAGFNVICIEEGKNPKFIGFGLNPAGVTVEEITEVLRKEYNKAEVNDSDQFTPEIATKLRKDHSKADVKKRRKLKTETLTSEQFKKRGGGRIIPEGYQALDTEKIEMLKNASTSVCQTLLKKWQNDYVVDFKKHHPMPNQ